MSRMVVGGLGLRRMQIIACSPWYMGLDGGIHVANLTRITAFELALCLRFIFIIIGPEKGWNEAVET